MFRHTSFQPWLSIWTSPRATIAKIVQEGPNKGLWLLAAIYGFSGLLNFFQSISVGTRIGLLPIFFLAILLSPLWGYVSFSLWSFAVWLTGKWVKGTASFSILRCAYAWSCVPYVINVLLWVLLAGVFGQTLFMNQVDGYALTRKEMAFLFLILVLRIGVGIWSLVIYLNALAEVQKYSVLRAIGNVLLALLLMGVVFWLLSFLLSIRFTT